MPDSELPAIPHEDVAICKAIYDEALSAVASQSAARQEIRSSVAWVMGVSTLAISVLGGTEVLSREERLGGLWSTVVIVLLFVFMCLAMRVWWPRDEWRSGINAQMTISLLEKWEPRGARQSQAAFYRNRALDLEADHDDNEAVLGKLQRAFRAAMVILVVALAILFTLVLLGGR